MTEIATLAGGCFWCTEAIFKQLKGISKVESGYAGGQRENPNYWQVASGATGHAESIQITFDPGIISYETLLTIFWRLHDPTTLNRQGADTGTEYRSIIFYHDEKQHEIAVKTKKELEESHYYKDPIVTEIVPYTAFYKAEENHQEFYEKNKGSFYCQVVIDPKLQKLLKEFKDQVK